MFSKKWWQAAGERAAKTGAQTLILMTGSDAAGFLHLDLQKTATLVLGGVILSLCTSIVWSPVTTDAES